MKVFKLEFCETPSGNKCRDNLGNKNYYCCDYFRQSGLVGDSCRLFGGRIINNLKLEECIKNAITALTEKAERERNGGWISVKDRLPEEYKDVLILKMQSSIGFIYIGTIFTFTETVTHWQPLPPTP